jgi:hypothetical protein
MAVHQTDRDIDVRPATGYEAPPEHRRRTFTETKLAFKTTEFWVMLAVAAGILISTYADDDTLAREDGWRFVTFIVAAYLVSRGLAKLGTREPYDDVERDHR